MKSRIQLSDHFTYRKLLQFVLPSIVMVYNFQLLRYLGEDGVSTYGVLLYVQFIFIAVDIGYSIGCAPIVGFHYGAQSLAAFCMEKPKTLLKSSTKCARI